MNNYIEYIGFFAGFCSTISFLPQIIKIWLSKSAKDISLLMYIVLSTGQLAWIVYGVLTNALPIIYANSVTLTLTLIILVLKLIWKD